MPSRKILLLMGFLTYVFYALLATEMGPALPEISSELRLSQGVAGVIASLQSLAGILAVLGGFLSDIFGRTRLIAISLGVIGLGAFFLSSSLTASMVGLSFFVMGTGFAFFEAAVNAFISNIFSDKRGLSINMLHIGWSVGSTLGPMLAATAILAYHSWRLGYLSIVPVMLTFSIFFGVLIPEAPNIKMDKEKVEAEPELSKMHLLISMLPIFLQSFLLMSCKLGMNTWLPYILQDQGVSLIESSLTISLFWMLVGVGRLVWAPFVDRLGCIKTVTFTSLGSLALLIPATLPIPIYYRMILYSSTGFLMGPIYPTLIASATARYPKISGTLVGAIYAFGTLGTVFSTIIIGLTIEFMGSSMAQVIFPITISLIAFILYLSPRYSRKQ